MLSRFRHVITNSVVIGFAFTASCGADLSGTADTADPHSPNNQNASHITSGSEVYGKVSQADSTDTFTGQAKISVDWAGALANYYSLGTPVADSLLQAMGLLADPNQNVLDALKSLSTKIDNFSRHITWHTAEEDRENRLSDLLAAVRTTDDATRSGSAVDWFLLDLNTSQSVGTAMNDTSFDRYYVAYDDGEYGLDADTPSPAIADISQGFTTWKMIIPYTLADLHYNNGYIYDWRLGVPALAQLIALRLQLMAMEDSNFIADRHFHDEIMAYHDAMKAHLTKMLAGIRCNAFTNFPSYDANYNQESHNVACAEISSGINKALNIGLDDPAMSAPLDTCPLNDDGYGYLSQDQACLDQWAQDYSQWYQTNLGPVLAQFYQEVRDQTPWQEMQALIDQLFRLANGGADPP